MFQYCIVESSYAKNPTCQMFPTQFTGVTRSPKTKVIFTFRISKPKEVKSGFRGNAANP